MVAVYKITPAPVFTSLGASIRWLSITTSFQSKVKLLSLSIMPSSSTPILSSPPFFSPPLPSPLCPLPAARKHTLITVSYL